MCLYSAVVDSPLTNLVVSTIGSLESLPSSLLPFTPEINLRKDKSNSFSTVIIIFSISWSSSLGLSSHLFGVESLSVIEFPLSSASSVICALFIITSFSLFVDFTLNSTLTSL